MAESKTEFVVEFSGEVKPAETSHAVESDASGAARRAAQRTLGAWTDGTMWIDLDGTRVGWTDWPPLALRKIADQYR